MDFKILVSNTRVEVFDYVKSYLDKNPEAQIMIGCDSQNKGDNTIYGVVLVLYRESKGGHVLYTRTVVPRIRDRWLRLWSEVERSVALANQLVEEGLPKANWIDIDLNPDPRYKSNDVIRAAVGLVESMGYKARTKPFAMTASYAADKICK
jgi:predicted RNase H-related nuclease YkuK (DUF458 family)